MEIVNLNNSKPHFSFTEYVKMFSPDLVHVCIRCCTLHSFHAGERLHVCVRLCVSPSPHAYVQCYKNRKMCTLFVYSCPIHEVLIVSLKSIVTIWMGC